MLVEYHEAFFRILIAAKCKYSKPPNIFNLHYVYYRFFHQHCLQPLHIIEVYAFVDLFM